MNGWILSIPVDQHWWHLLMISYGTYTTTMQQFHANCMVIMNGIPGISYAFESLGVTRCYTTFQRVIITTVSWMICSTKGLTNYLEQYIAYAWQIGPFWQYTLDMHFLILYISSHTFLWRGMSARIYIPQSSLWTVTVVSKIQYNPRIMYKTYAVVFVKVSWYRSSLPTTFKIDSLALRVIKRLLLDLIGATMLIWMTKDMKYNYSKTQSNKAVCDIYGAECTLPFATFWANWFINHRLDMKWNS